MILAFFTKHIAIFLLLLLVATQVAAAPKTKEQSYNPNATPVSPSQAPYNPFDEFSHNEFVQTEFDGNL